MNNVVKKYNILLDLLIVVLPLLWIFNVYNNNLANTVINIVTILFIIFTVFISLKTNITKKIFQKYIILIMCLSLAPIIMSIFTENTSFDTIVELSTSIILPLWLLTIDEIRISDRVYGLLIIIVGLFSLFNIGNRDVLTELSCILAPLTFIIIYKDNNLLLKLIYIIANFFILSLFINEQLYVILLSITELAILLLNKTSKKIDFIFMILFFISAILISFERLSPFIPITFVMSTFANKGFIKEKKRLLFTAINLEIGGIETALVNLLNKIDKDKYDLTLILEEKKGILLDEISDKVYIKEYKVFNFKPSMMCKVLNLLKRSIYSLLNYNTYDFSCCYATYSYCGNKLAKISSDNSSIWVHSNYKYVYKNIEDTKEFFNTRKMNEFRKIIFVSNESRNTYLELYPEHKDKSLVMNNFINIDRIEEKKKEKVEISKPKNKKLLVFIGRLEEESKKITRLIEIANNISNIYVWIIGDGKDRDLYQKLIKEYKLEKRVLMLGSKKEPYNYMDKADYLILTSDYEGFPVVYLEALALNKEIITTIPVSAGKIDMNERAHIISKNNYIDDVKSIIKKKEIKNSKVDLNNIQNERMIKLEKLFDGVI